MLCFWASGIGFPPRELAKQQFASMVRSRLSSWPPCSTTRDGTLIRAWARLKSFRRQDMSLA
jgi:hypothetical protein